MSGTIDPRSPDSSDTGLEEWEIKLLIATVIAENFGGRTPASWQIATAWAYLNRISKGIHGNLWAAVQGNQSAFRCWYQVCDGVAPPYKDALDDKPTISEVIDFVNRLYEEKIHKSEWINADKLVRYAYDGWLKGGTGSSLDPTGGATDFKHKTVGGEEGKDYETAIKSYPNRTGTAWPDYFYYVLGPIEIEGLTVYNFVDNYSEMRIKCQQNPQCEALWPKPSQ